MQKSLFLFVALFATAFVNVQAKTSASAGTGLSYNKGQSLIHAGVGLGSAFGMPISIGYENGITDKISLGAMFGYASKSYAWLTDNYKVTSMLIVARGNYHFYVTDKIDAYGGITLGYNKSSISYPSSWGTGTGWVIPSYGGLTYGFQVGARYFFNPKIAVFGEAGYGLAYLTVGLAMKF